MNMTVDALISLRNHVISEYIEGGITAEPPVTGKILPQIGQSEERE
jgi:hypothetical protein